MGCVRLWCSGYSLLRDPQYKKGLTNALVIQLTPCFQFVLAIMLAKKGFQPILPIIGFEPMTYCLLFKGGQSAKKEEALSLFEMVQQLAC